MTLALALIGWLAFAGLGILFVRKISSQSNLQQEVTRLQTQLEEGARRFADQKQIFEESQAALEKSFDSMAGRALAQNNDSFLKLASERLDKKTTEAKGTFEKNVIEFQKLVEPIREALLKVEGDLSRVEKDRLAQFSKISEQLLAVNQSSESLRKEASSLTSALRRPEVRGSWGELQLRRVVELAGMSPYCDFEEQVAKATEDGLQKPDMVVKLPNHRVIVVDAKAVLDAFLDAVQAEDPIKKTEALARHARNIRSRVQALSKKSYWEQFDNTPDFCVLFIPNEALLASAVEVDQAIIEDALKEKIIIATPTTLVALLKAIAYGWQQNQMADNAQKILDSAKELFDRISTWSGHMTQVGDRLEGAVKAYNSAIGSLESRVLPSAKRLQDLGIGVGEELPDLASIDLTTRKLIENTEV